MIDIKFDRWGDIVLLANGNIVIAGFMPFVLEELGLKVDTPYRLSFNPNPANMMSFRLINSAYKHASYSGGRVEKLVLCIDGLVKVFGSIPEQFYITELPFNPKNKTYAYLQ